MPCPHLSAYIVDDRCIDDELWCARTAAELDLDELQLRASPGAAAVSVRLDVGGVTDPLAEPRATRLIAAVRRYRRCDGVALFAADGSWRFSFESGRTIAYLPGRTRERPIAPGPREKL